MALRIGLRYTGKDEVFGFTFTVYSFTSVVTIYLSIIYLLPIGSEKRGELGVGRIPVAILPFYQNMNTVVFKLHRYEYSWVVKIRNTS